MFLFFHLKNTSCCSVADSPSMVGLSRLSSNSFQPRLSLSYVPTIVVVCRLLIVFNHVVPSPIHQPRLPDAYLRTMVVLSPVLPTFYCLLSPFFPRPLSSFSTFLETIFLATDAYKYLPTTGVLSRLLLIFSDRDCLSPGGGPYRSRLHLQGLQRCPDPVPQHVRRRKQPRVFCQEGARGGLLVVSNCVGRLFVSHDMCVVRVLSSRKKLSRRMSVVRVLSSPRKGSVKSAHEVC